MQILTYEEDLAMQKDMILREGKAEGLRQGKAEGREIGKAEGMREGRDEERARYGRLVQRLFAVGRQDDILRAAEDNARLEELYREFDI